MAIQTKASVKFSNFISLQFPIYIRHFSTFLSLPPRPAASALLCLILRDVEFGVFELKNKHFFVLFIPPVFRK